MWIVHYYLIFLFYNLTFATTVLHHIIFLFCMFKDYFAIFAIFVHRHCLACRCSIVHTLEVFFLTFSMISLRPTQPTRTWFRNPLKNKVFSKALFLDDSNLRLSQKLWIFQKVIAYRCELKVIAMYEKSMSNVLTKYYYSCSIDIHLNVLSWK